MKKLTFKDIVYDTLSTSIIVEGRPKVYMVQKMIYFGSYAMVHIGKTNTMKIRCVLGISLKAPNDFGRYYFINIFTGKKCNATIGHYYQ